MKTIKKRLGRLESSGRRFSQFPKLIEEPDLARRFQGARTRARSHYAPREVFFSWDDFVSDFI